MRETLLNIGEGDDDLAEFVSRASLRFFAILGATQCSWRRALRDATRDAVCQKRPRSGRVDAATINMGMGKVEEGGG